jgi:iron complex outermembrane receptor protein
VEEALLARWQVLENLRLVPAVHVAVEQLSLVPLAAPPLHAERVSGRVALGAEWQPHPIVGVRVTGTVECDGTAAGGHSPWALAGDAPLASTLRPCADAEPTARLGVQVGNKPLALLVNGGRYARVPTLAERYGISGAVRGNAQLGSEQGLSADLGIRASAPASWRIHEAAIDLFGFARYANDLIAYEHTSSGFVQPFNVGRARVLGAELAATISPIRYVRIDLAATALDPRNVSPSRTTVNDLLPYQARLVLTPRVEGRVPIDTRVLRALKLAASYFYEAARYDDPAGLTVIAPQGSLDVEAEAALLDDHLFLRGRLANVLDQPRVDFIGYPLPGRAGYVNLEARW